MPTIPLMSYNVFTVMDDDLLDGIPERRDDPYTDPVPNWANSRVHDGQAEADDAKAPSWRAAAQGGLRRPP